MAVEKNKIYEIIEAASADGNLLYDIDGTLFINFFYKIDTHRHP